MRTLLAFRLQWSDKVCWVDLTCYMTHAIIVLSLWSLREVSQVMVTELMATWASPRSCFISYPKGEAGLFLTSPKLIGCLGCILSPLSFLEPGICSFSHSSRACYGHLLCSNTMVIQPCSFRHMWFIAASVPHQQGGVVTTESSGPAKPKRFTIWPFTRPRDEKVWKRLLCDQTLNSHQWFLTFPPFVMSFLPSEWDKLK